AATALAETAPANKFALHYLNRLSDLLFVAARAENNGGKSDVLWVPALTSDR
ncbi:MAG: ATP:cob(I)alamin adenosyltransferase, partial [Alphaproteobacteria bacterium]